MARGPAEITSFCAFYTPSSPVFPSVDGCRRKSARTSKAAGGQPHVALDSNDTPLLSHLSSNIVLLDRILHDAVGKTGKFFRNARVEAEKNVAAKMLDSVYQHLLNDTADAVRETPVPRIMVKQYPVLLLKLDVGCLEDSTETLITEVSDVLKDSAPNVDVTVLDGNVIRCLNDISSAMEDIHSQSEEAAEKWRGNEASFLHSFLKQVREKALKSSAKKKTGRKTEEKCSAASAFFFITNAEGLSKEILDNFTEFLYKTGTPSIVALLFRAATAVLHSSTEYPPLKLREERSTCGVSVEILEKTMLELLTPEHLPFIFGPAVIKFLMSSLNAFSGSWEQMCTAVTICCLRKYAAIPFPLEELNRNPDIASLLPLVSYCWALPSFIKYCEELRPDEQIELLLDRKTCLRSMQKFREDFIEFRAVCFALVEVIHQVILPVIDLPWWEIYIVILSGKPWKDCIVLQNDMSMDTSEAIVCSLKKCLDLLTQPGKPHAAATLASVIGRYCDTIHSATTQVDVLTRWQIKSRQGSPLIPLLQELCSCLRPMKTLVLWELFVFDDAEAVAAILTPRIKSSIESDLLNPGDLLTGVVDLNNDSERPDICHVVRNMQSEQRAFSLHKSFLGFHKACLKEEDNTATLSPLPYSPAIRARFMTCLPALQSLGILTLKQRGKTRTYTIV